MRIFQVHVYFVRKKKIFGRAMILAKINTQFGFNKVSQFQADVSSNSTSKSFLFQVLTTNDHWSNSKFSTHGPDFLNEGTGM